MREVIQETITGTLSWCKILPLNGFNTILAKQKSSHETEKLFLKEPSQAPKVVYTDNSMEFGKACEVLSWNHRTSTPHRIRDKWHRWKSRPMCEWRHISSFATVRIGWKVLVRLHEMLLLSSNCPRPPGRWENAKRERIWRTNQSANDTFWCNGWISPVFNERPGENHQFCKKVLPTIFLGYELIARRIWKGDIESRSGRIGNFGCTMFWSSKTQRQRSTDHTKKMNSISQ